MTRQISSEKVERTAKTVFASGGLTPMKIRGKLCKLNRDNYRDSASIQV
jgi:hypothetical protein